MSNKKIGNKMPFAVFFMVLLNDKNVSFSDERVKRLAYPLYYSNKGDAEKNISYIKHFSAELYDSTGNGGKICFRADADEFYEDIYNHRSEYCFSAILKLFAHFYDEKSIQTIASKDDVKECYRIMIDNRTDIPSTKFDSEYCWKIAQLFLIEYSHVESITLEESYVRRREMIRNASGTVYFGGTTLRDAFSTASNMATESIINDLFSNKNIHTINIFLLNYVYVAVKQESASKEIELTINNILDKIEQSRRCPNINIVLLSDFDIPFSLLTENTLLTRSTHLFTEKREYRGQYLVFGKNAQEYKSALKYFELLLKNAYDIDLYSKKKSQYAVKERLRNDAENGGKISCFLSYRKIHPIQLENIVRNTFVYQNGEGKSKNLNNFSEQLKPDSTQRLILPYLQETENLLEAVVKEHDREGWAKIIPAADLGFPNNVTRIAGGFMTGALYDWSCTVPIIPIDATVNTCTSSVFRLGDFDESMTNEQFESIIDALCKRAMNNSYVFNFKSGNHFLIVAKDDEGNYYLVLHCSETRSKASYIGLYPNSRVWYAENIKTKYNKAQTRYLRYIRGDAAVKFVDYANRFREESEEIHRYTAEEFAKLIDTHVFTQDAIIKHHYGMPTSSSVAIGTFTIDVYSRDRIVPVFSDFGRDICLYEVSNHQNNVYNLAGTNKNIVLVPHGWGQVIDDIKNIRVKNARNEKERELLLEFSESTLSVPVNPTERLNLTQKHIRQFDSIGAFFEENCSHINGSVKKILHPVFCYCDYSVKNKTYRINRSGE